MKATLPSECPFAKIWLMKRLASMQEGYLLQQRKRKQPVQILFVTALDLLKGRSSSSDTINQQESDGTCYNGHFKNAITIANSSSLQNNTSNSEKGIDDNSEPAAILHLRVPFELKPDQVKAVEAWLANNCRGSIIYGSGTGKTEIAFECAKRAVAAKRKSSSRGEDSTAYNDHDSNNGTNIQGSFNVLMLVPRIVLVEQNYNRLVTYGIPPDKIGRYFGEQKEIREITISTYHSATDNKRNLEIIKRANMVVFDEVHLASATARAFSRIFDIVAEDKHKALLGLTATIDEHDPVNSTIMALLPPVRKYLIKDAVKDGRLARPIIFPLKVTLTAKEQRAYEEYSKKIRTISTRFKRYDPNAMMKLLKSGSGGFPRWQARAWFLNVRKRKSLLASAENKLATTVEMIKTKHPNQKVMVFSETLESIRKLKQLLKTEGIDSALVDSKIPSVKRQKILSQWGSKFYPLLSVHTLEIGYDVPEAGVEIILASTSNINQIVQRIGRVLRKVEDKNTALVYVIYVSETRDNNILALVKNAIESSGGGRQEPQREEKDKLLQQQDALPDN
ncbi:MAG TPA: DEAD/DEAH box helicase [Nitrososphaeraceae archaeon]|nr:DEAD/DEAH box helicase [Nitrososphaeraceae archaeon]